MKRLPLTLFFILVGGLFAWAQWTNWKANKDWKTVERLIGYPGQAQGDGFKVTVPRLDLNVLVHGSLVDPRAGLSSWFAFKPLPHGTLLSGDLVVVDSEVPRVEAQLTSSGLRLTSFYRPFNGETPGVERIGFTGKGPRVLLAQAVKALLAATTMPLALDPPLANTLPPSHTAFSLPLEKILGPAQWVGGYLKFSFTPTEPVTEEGVVIPSYMGLESAFYFQPEGKQAKAYGEWVLTQAEAENVSKVLMKNHIEVTGLHAQLLNQTPALVYVDYWAEGDPEKIAKALKEAVRFTQLVGWTPGAPQETHQP